MIETILWFVAVPVAFIVGWASCGSISRRNRDAEVESAYKTGIIEGQQMETEWAVRTAVEAERLAVERRLHDSGRRHAPREAAGEATIHKARVGSPRPNNPRR